MGGLLSHRKDDPPMLVKMATEYKVPMKNARTLNEHFEGLDTLGLGLLARSHPSLIALERESANPLMGRIIDSHFYDPHSVDPYYEMDSELDLERLFAVISLFLHPRDLAVPCGLLLRAIQDGERMSRKEKRMMLLFRIVKGRGQSHITVAALLQVARLTYKGPEEAELQTMVLTAFGEVHASRYTSRGVLQEGEICFRDFFLACDKLAIDQIFAEEVADSL
jgi:hypothetical protein